MAVHAVCGMQLLLGLAIIRHLGLCRFASFVLVVVQSPQLANSWYPDHMSACVHLCLQCCMQCQHVVLCLNMLHGAISVPSSLAGIVLNPMSSANSNIEDGIDMT